MGSMGLVMDFYVASIVSFRFPHIVDVCALSICFVCFVLSICLLYVSLRSRMIPSILGLRFMSMVLFICSTSCILLGLACRECMLFWLDLK